MLLRLFPLTVKLHFCCNCQVSIAFVVTVIMRHSYCCRGSCCRCLNIRRLEVEPKPIVECNFHRSRLVRIVAVLLASLGLSTNLWFWNNCCHLSSPYVYYYCPSRLGYILTRLELCFQANSATIRCKQSTGVNFIPHSSPMATVCSVP